MITIDLETGRELIRENLWLEDEVRRLEKKLLKYVDPHERKCEGCGAVFIYGRGTGRRVTSIFCSPKCRKRTYYKRALANDYL